jgi:hypothetical protein
MLCLSLIQLFQEHLYSIAHDLVACSLPALGEPQKKLFYVIDLAIGSCATNVKTDDVDAPHRTVPLFEPMHILISELSGRFGLSLLVEEADRQYGTGYSTTHFSRHQASLQSYGDAGDAIVVLPSSLADRKEYGFGSAVALKLLQGILDSCLDGDLTGIDHLSTFHKNGLRPVDGKAGSVKRSGIWSEELEGFNCHGSQ